MKTLIFGGGGLSQSFARTGDRTVLKAGCDVTDYLSVVGWVDEYRPDQILCTAGLSDKVVGVRIRDVIEANLIGPINVGTVAAAFGTPCVLVASTAGIVPGDHQWYGPAKAGVINFVRSQGYLGRQTYAVSPGRMDTRMRDDDFPDEDPRTRLAPWIVAGVIRSIFAGDYAPGANVVVRKVGYDRIDIYEEAAPTLPSLL